MPGRDGPRMKMFPFPFAPWGRGEGRDAGTAQRLRPMPFFSRREDARERRAKDENVSFPLCPLGARVGKRRRYSAKAAVNAFFPFGS